MHVTQVKRSVPPRRLPSLERAMLCDLRTRAVKSLAALMQHDEVGAGLAPLVSDLTRVALGSVPQVRDGFLKIFPTRVPLSTPRYGVHIPLFLVASQIA